MNNVMQYQERLSKEYRYKKLPHMIANEAMKLYLNNIPEMFKGEIKKITSGKGGYEIEGKNVSLYTMKGTYIAKRYSRIVIGHYGAFIEIDPSDIIRKDIICKKGQEYRIDDPKYNKNVKYQWFTTNDDTNCKLYFQQREVTYADYKANMWYISPYECFMLVTEPFYLLVAGSRTFNNYPLLKAKLDNLLQYQRDKEIHIVSGGARGADILAEWYAKEKGYEMHVFPADWNRYGKLAGIRRNTQMHQFIAQYPNRGCVCFWDGQSRGTKHNFELCKQYNTPLRKVMF